MSVSGKEGGEKKREKAVSVAPLTFCTAAKSGEALSTALGGEKTVPTESPCVYIIRVWCLLMQPVHRCFGRLVDLFFFYACVCGRHL